MSTILGHRNRVTRRPNGRTVLGAAIAIRGGPTSVSNEPSSEAVDVVCPIVERSEGIGHRSKSCTLLDWLKRAITYGQRGARSSHTGVAIVTESSGVQNTRSGFIGDCNDSEGDSGGWFRDGDSSGGGANAGSRGAL